MQKLEGNRELLLISRASFAASQHSGFQKDLRMETAGKCELTSHGMSHSTEPYPVMCTISTLKLAETRELSLTTTPPRSWAISLNGAPGGFAGTKRALVRLKLVSVSQCCLTNLYFQMMLRAQHSSWETVANTNHPTRLD